MTLFSVCTRRSLICSLYVTRTRACVLSRDERPCITIILYKSRGFFVHAHVVRLSLALSLSFARVLVTCPLHSSPSRLVCRSFASPHAPPHVSLQIVFRPFMVHLTRSLSLVVHPLSLFLSLSRLSITQAHVSRALFSLSLSMLRVILCHSTDQGLGVQRSTLLVELTSTRWRLFMRGKIPSAVVMASFSSHTHIRLPRSPTLSLCNTTHVHALPSFLFISLSHVRGKKGNFSLSHQEGGEEKKFL
jgi:hypothetical protein